MREKGWKKDFKAALNTEKKNVHVSLGSSGGTF
jgi:hypothetical protein